ncbi:uncharacterized protein LOC106705830 [Latimeria chalumnae]|uniref:uncharacterized protein LOC106705830 n=1 Tax=Latimeria chalumnae TaxID=7897 RepID=UPI00313B5E79
MNCLKKIEELQKTNLKLKEELKIKDNTISILTKTIQDKAVEHCELIKVEQNFHSQTKDQLTKVQCLLSEKTQELHDSTKHYEATILELKKQHECTIAALKKQMNFEISQKNESIAKLKQQISEILKGNSWQRQQQLEELRKDFNRLSEEAQTLQKKLKMEQIQKRECDHCNSLTSKLENKTLQLRLKDRTIEELQALCKRFEKQLIQDNLLKAAFDKNTLKKNLN